VRLMLFIARTSTSSPRFPYTTLFRSNGIVRRERLPEEPRAAQIGCRRGDVTRQALRASERPCFRERGARVRPHVPHGHEGAAARSEEHTSELQSRENLVCRLLLEKKN